MRPSLGLILAPFAFGCSSLPRDEVAATPQRPSVASSPATTAAGTFEQELGTAWDPGDVFAVIETTKYGVRETSEVFVTWLPYIDADSGDADGQGVGDLFVGWRERFVDEDDSSPALAAQLSVKAPTGDDGDGLSTGEWDGFAAGMISKNLGGIDHSGYYELGILGDEDDSGVEVSHVLALDQSVALDNGWGLMGEISGTDVPEQSLTYGLFLTGLTYSPYPALVIDASVAVGFGADSPDFLLLVGLTRNLGPKPKRRIDG